MYSVTELMYTYEQSYYVLCDRVRMYSVTKLMYTYEQSYYVLRDRVICTP